MRRATPFALAAISVLAVVPTAQAVPPDVVAPALEQCRAERDANPVAFRTKYATPSGRHAMRRCLRAQVRDVRKACRAERDTDSNAFILEYADARGRNAMARCVAETISQDDPGPVIPTEPPEDIPS